MGPKTLGVMALIIGLLFWTTLRQARELGGQDGIISMLNAEIVFGEKLNAIKIVHQTALDQKDRDNDIETQKLKNTIIDQAVEFETKGLTDPIGLSDDNTKWLNDFMRENSRRDDPGPTGDIPSAGASEGEAQPDRDNGN